MNIKKDWLTCQKGLVISGVVAITALFIGMSWSEYYGYHKGQKEFFLETKVIADILKPTEFLDKNNSKKMIGEFYVLQEHYKFERNKLMQLKYINKAE